MLDVKYEGDERFQVLLDQLECPKSIREIIALLNGVVAAPIVIGISRVIPAIFDDEEPVFESMEQAKYFMSNLYGLMEVINRSHNDDIYYSDRVEYPANFRGLKERIEDKRTEINAFVKGLGLGVVDIDDFPESCRETLSNMAKGTAFLEGYLNIFEEKEPPQNEIKDIVDSLDKLEYVINSIITAQEVVQSQRLRRGPGCG